MRAGICESLHEVAEAVAAGQTSSLALGNLLAFLRPGEVQEAIDQAPPLLAGRHPSGAILDAYLAAVAELLAQKHGAHVPSWTQDPARFLAQFHYPSHNQRLNELLLQETPEPFLKRRIVVSANVLDVA
jgi:hypothetical protein